MSADILERLDFMLISRRSDEDAIIRDARAEIVRLRGEVASRQLSSDVLAEACVRAGVPDSIYEQIDAELSSTTPAEAKGDGDELKSIANDIALLRERGTPLSRELALIELRIRSAAEAANTPQPAGGEAVAWMTPGGDVSRSWFWCDERCLPGEKPRPLYTHPPAAQVQPVCPATDCGAQVLYECPACSHHNYPPREPAHPSACELGVPPEMAIAASGIRSSGMYVKGWNDCREAALQHRGDSQEVDRV